MRRILKVLALIGVIALVTAACGDSSGDGSPTTQANSEGPDEPGATTTVGAPDSTAPDSGGETPDVTELGSFTVNGTEFAVTLLNRCVPFSGPDSGEIDLQALAQGQNAELFLYGNGDSVEVTVQGGTIEEMFGSIAFASDFGTETDVTEISGDRWTGSATVFDAFQVADPIEVSYDVMVIEEVNDCGL